MKIVFVKHNGDNKEYAFALHPEQTVSRGDLVFLETIQGKAFGIAASGVEEASEGVLKKLGAYLPLKPVIGIIPHGRFPAALSEIAEALKGAQDIPF